MQVAHSAHIALSADAWRCWEDICDFIAGHTPMQEMDSPPEFVVIRRTPEIESAIWGNRPLPRKRLIRALAEMRRVGWISRVGGCYVVAEHQMERDRFPDDDHGHMTPGTVRWIDAPPTEHTL